MGIWLRYYTLPLPLTGDCHEANCCSSVVMKHDEEHAAIGMSCSMWCGRTWAPVMRHMTVSFSARILLGR